MILYGLSGTNGSGKDSLATYLVRECNFLYISSSDLLRAEAKKRGLEVEREVLRTISAQWRREGGLGVLIDKAVETYSSEGGDVAYAGLITGSLRNPGEADRIHQLGGTMIWVDADPIVRYQRITNADRGRGDTEAQKSYETFLEEEAAEMQHSGDAATLSMADVKEKCDIFVENDGNDIAEFEKMVKDRLKLS
jgi:cytidylate kinase